MEERLGVIALGEEAELKRFLLCSAPLGQEELRDCTLSITAGPQSTGVWGYGSGCRMFDMVKVEFRRGFVYLHHPVALVASIILARAAQLVHAEECEVPVAFFQVERYPQGVYTEP
ncbi:MAG: hypothetical protein AAB394_01065 [Patescibacteria group bacterium]